MEGQFRSGRSGAVKAVNLQQCMGTAEGSSMWLGEEWAASMKWSEQQGQCGGSREDQWGEEYRGSTLVP